MFSWFSLKSETLLQHRQHWAEGLAAEVRSVYGAVINRTFITSTKGLHFVRFFCMCVGSRSVKARRPPHKVCLYKGRLVAQNACQDESAITDTHRAVKRCHLDQKGDTFFNASSLSLLGEEKKKRVYCCLGSRNYTHGSRKKKAINRRPFFHF